MSNSTEFEKAYRKLPKTLKVAVNMFDGMIVSALTPETLRAYAAHEDQGAHPRIRPLLAEIAQAKIDERAKRAR
jgi:hypothetical protein